MQPLSPSDMLCFALYAAAHKMQKRYKPLLTPLGLTYPQYLVLSALWTQNDQTVGSLGHQLQLESNTLTPLLKRMQSKDLISRHRDTQDERQVRVQLTDTGRALQSKAAHIPDCIAQATGLSLDEITALRDQLADLRARLDDS